MLYPYSDKLARRTWGILWGPIERFVTIGGGVVSFLVVFNHPLLESLVRQWQGVSWWWGLVLMGTLLLQAFFRASYKEYQEGEKERDGLKKTLWANTKEQEGLAQKLLAVEQERDDLRIENEELIAELANEPEIVEQVFTGPQPGITTGLKPHPQELPSDAASRKHISRMSFRILELLPRGENRYQGQDL